MPLHKTDVVLHILVIGQGRWIVVVRPVAIYNLPERDKVAYFRNACEYIVSLVGFLAAETNASHVVVMKMGHEDVMDFLLRKWAHHVLDVARYPFPGTS